MTQVMLHQLSKTYPNMPQASVSGVQLEIPSGQLVALLGPSGCGKTTILKMIAGLVQPTAGDITFDGHSILAIPAERRGAVMVFQNSLLFPYMSVGENVGFGLKMRGMKKTSIRQKVSAMLDLVKLPGVEHRRPNQLSGGQQQRVALARALVTEPHVLLLDEPLSNLDAHLRDDMRQLILSVQRELKVTTIVVTHDQQEAMVLADKIALIFDGMLQQYAVPSDFYERPVSVRTARFFGGLNLLQGKVCGTQFSSTLGIFQISNYQRIKDGPAVLTVRPEHLQILSTKHQSNCIEARIRSQLYMGTHIRYKLTVDEYEFEAVSLPDSQYLYREGDRVYMYFPIDKAWLLPDEITS